MHNQLFCLVFLVSCSWLQAQMQGLPENILARNTFPFRAGSGYGFTEGSSAAADGRVFFTDQPNDRIYVWDEKSGIQLFKEACERSNGTYFDSTGNLYACADLYNKIVKFAPDGQMTEVYSRGYSGQPFNGPNDLWIDRHGGIYFTDPYYQRDYWEAGHHKTQEVEAVYYLDPSGRLIRIITDLGQPNGIVGTPDGKVLYVADIQGRTTWKYAINPDGSLGNKTFFTALGSDGMTLDSSGNVYLTFGKVVVINPAGEKLGEIELPEAPSNVCFGGGDRKTLFITARTSVYTLRMNIGGVE
jgi:gluconolactonase